MTDYNRLVKALRYCTNEDNVCTKEKNCGYYGKGFFCQDALMNDAADAIEALQAEIRESMQRCAECGDELAHQMPNRGEIVRCGECKYWSEVDTSDGLRYGQCDHPHSAIRGNCFIRESWFCADGEREVQE